MSFHSFPPDRDILRDSRSHAIIALLLARPLSFTFRHMYRPSTVVPYSRLVWDLFTKQVPSSCQSKAKEKRRGKGSSQRGLRACTQGSAELRLAERRATVSQSCVPAKLDPQYRP